MKSSLRIGLNMWTHTNTQAGGMVYYALSMLREFCRMVPERMVLFHGAHGKELVSTVKEISGVRRIELKNPAELHEHRSLFDILFSPTVWGGVNMLDMPAVNVVPDIQEKYYPEFFSNEELELRDTMVGHAARASTLLITISNFSKRSIVEKFGIPEEKVRVTHLAAHPIFSDDSLSGIRSAGLPEKVDRFLLYPSNSWAHKNHRRLLDALLDLRKRYELEIPCVFTGHILKGKSHHVDLIREIELRGLEKQVFHLGTVSLAQLKYLYLHAAALVHPSLFEGFGIPLVEAMSAGCPVIAAHATSLPEIAGEAALYFDPTNATDIADKIYRFATHPDEVRERVALGRELARNFNDARTAKATLRILEDAYHIAGPESLKARAAPVLAVKKPILSLLLVLEHALEKEMVQGIEELLTEFSASVTVNAIAPESAGERIAELFGERVSITLLHASVREAVSRASQDLKGEYVFLSDGKSVILPSLVHYLAANDTSLRGCGEFFQGEWYDKVSGRKGLIDSPILPERDEEKRKAYVCENLSFLVRPEALRRVVNQQSARDDSISGIASDLWDQCSRKRIFRTVALRFVKESGGEAYNLSLVARKLKERFPSRPWLQRLLSTRAGNRFLAFVVQTYYRVPGRLQRGMLRAYKTIASYQTRG